MARKLALEEIKNRILTAEKTIKNIKRETSDLIYLTTNITFNGNKKKIGRITLHKINATTWRIFYIGTDSEDLYFIAKYRQLGIGKELWEKGIELAKKKGTKRIAFEALKEAYPFYKKLGAKKVHWEDIPTLSDSIEMYYDTP